MVSKTSGSSGYSAGRIRARDVDRVNTRALLDIAYEEGQLGADEYHERSERAAAAETLAELHPLVEDLQPSPQAADLRLPKPEAVGPKHRGNEYPPRVRAREQDRAAACALLDAALGDGQLSEEDHRALTELAGAAKTLGDLAELTADLQRSAGAPAEPRRPRSRRGWFAAGVAVAAVCAAVAGFLATHRTPSAPAPLANPVPRAVQPLVVPMPQLTTADGFALIREQYRAKFGGTVVDELTLFPEHASVEAAPTGQQNRLVRYTYRGGFLPSGDPTTRRTDTPAFDLASVDPAVLARLLAEAPGLLKVDGGTVSHIGFEPDSSSREPRISVYVGNRFNESGYLQATPAGDKVRVYPFGR
ncbi:DUF1707 SHOCT-like domain-containing protein [Nocardia blacklockiae]|uniref:DUF1707 SHOCT-like domain-containing protein n=1 Tax=Nocardia blacklockiae TaxID=480036 RepID=UPI001893E772|nr:DUF1707 domain-containing protein [Nocardia blacklockiae]MBF6175488.1 DUF1707 domain-containing protein [Nocardia blacklockiae]